MLHGSLSINKLTHKVWLMQAYFKINMYKMKFRIQPQPEEAELTLYLK